VDERQWTPLHYAAYNGHQGVCKQLLSFSADTDPKLRDARNSQNRVAFNICKDPKTKLGFRILWVAARDGDLDLVRILSREGDNINAQTQHKKNTPLHLAAQNGHILVVKYLIEELRANVKLGNIDNKLPLDLAKQSLQQEIAKEQEKIGKAKKLPKKWPKGSLIDRLEVTVKTLEKSTNETSAPAETMMLDGANNMVRRNTRLAKDDDYENEFDDKPVVPTSSNMDSTIKKQTVGANRPTFGSSGLQNLGGSTRKF